MFRGISIYIAGVLIALLASTYASGGEPSEIDKEIERYTKAMESDPKESSLYLDRGDAYQRKKDFKNALKDFNRAMELAPKKTGAFVCRGKLYLELKDFNEALKDFSSAITIDPKCVAAYDNRGLAHCGKGDDEKALQDFAKAIQIDAKYPLSYMNRGILYQKLKRTEEAIADYTTSYDAIKARIAELKKEADAHKKKNELNDAFEHLIEAGMLFDKSYVLMFKRGTAYVELGKNDTAIKDFRLAIKLYPFIIEAYIEIASIYSSVGKYNEAIKEMDSAIDKGSSREKKERAGYYLKRGDIHMLLNNIDKAKKDFQSALDLDPDCAEARRKLKD